LIPLAKGGLNANTKSLAIYRQHLLRRHSRESSVVVNSEYFSSPAKSAWLAATLFALSCLSARRCPLMGMVRPMWAWRPQLIQQRTYWTGPSFAIMQRVRVASRLFLFVWTSTSRTRPRRRRLATDRPCGHRFSDRPRRDTRWCEASACKRSSCTAGQVSQDRVVDMPESVARLAQLESDLAHIESTATILQSYQRECAGPPIVPPAASGSTVVIRGSGSALVNRAFAR
jgi:hypothetical protein